MVAGAGKEGKTWGPETFGERVRRLREARRRTDRRFSLRKFAQAVGMSPTYLSKVERGEVPPPAEEKIRAIAQALEVDPEELLGLAGRLPRDVTEVLRRRAPTLTPLVRAAARLPDKEVRRILRRIEDGEW